MSDNPDGLAEPTEDDPTDESFPDASPPEADDRSGSADEAAPPHGIVQVALEALQAMLGPGDDPTASDPDDPTG